MAAELVSPAMIEAASAREALVCIVAEKIVAFRRRLLLLWLLVGCLVLKRD